MSFGYKNGRAPGSATSLKRPITPTTPRRLLDKALATAEQDGHVAVQLLDIITRNPALFGLELPESEPQAFRLVSDGPSFGGLGLLAGLNNEHKDAAL